MRPRGRVETAADSSGPEVSDGSPKNCSNRMQDLDHKTFLLLTKYQASD